MTNSSTSNVAEIGTVGRLDRPYLQISKIEKNCVTFMVMRPEGCSEAIMKGYVTVRQTDEGYCTSNVESWTNDTDSFYKTKKPFSACVLRVLSVARFHAILSSKDKLHELEYGKLIGTGYPVGKDMLRDSVSFYDHADGRFSVDFSNDHKWEEEEPAAFAYLANSCGITLKRLGKHQAVAAEPVCTTA
jgi:hypothetical protein